MCDDYISMKKLLKRVRDNLSPLAFTFQSCRVYKHLGVKLQLDLMELCISIFET